MKTKSTLNAEFQPDGLTSSQSKTKTAPSFLELIAVVTMMMSLTALSIDAMLPALPQIATELGVTDANQRQLIISTIFLGQAFGQLYFGPLSDKTGRKPAIYAGYALFILGSILSVISTNFPMMLAGRALQGIGISGPRAVSLAIIRDKFEGRLMARFMSFTSTIFILVPMIAPTIGQGILAIAGWRSIFGSFTIFAVITVIWYAIRIPETLAPEKRVPFTAKRLWASIKEIVKIRSALGFTLAAGLVSGVFLGYLNSSQQIFQEMYLLGEKFPIYFATISLSMGTASFLNTKLVMRFGMHSLVRWAIRTIFGLAVVYLIVGLIFGGQPPLWTLMTYLMATFFSTGILFGNMNALAMQPLGHLAGLGSAAVGSVSTLISTVIGTYIGQSYNGTILPLVIGMTLLSGISIFVIRWASAEFQAE